MKKIIYITFIILSYNQSISNQMGVLDELFENNKQIKKGKIYDVEIEKTSEMLDEKTFWNIIELSNKITNNQDDQELFLLKEIEKLTPNEMIGFRLRMDKLLYDIYNSEMWCAAHIMNNGCSGDGFEYFRIWIISRGKTTYYNAKENPDSLISEFVEGLKYYDFEAFGYIPLTAFENKTGKNLYNFISDDFITNEGNYPDFKFTWKEEKPETMKAICPKLFNKMWN